MTGPDPVSDLAVVAAEAAEVAAVALREPLGAECAGDRRWRLQRARKALQTALRSVDALVPTERPQRAPRPKVAKVPAPELAALGDELRLARERAGLSVEVAAAVLGFATPRSLALLEAGHHPPAVRTVEKLRTAYVPADLADRFGAVAIPPYNNKERVPTVTDDRDRTA